MRRIEHRPVLQSEPNRGSARSAGRSDLLELRVERGKRVDQGTQDRFAAARIPRAGKRAQTESLPVYTTHPLSSFRKPIGRPALNTPACFAGSPGRPSRFKRQHGQGSPQPCERPRQSRRQPSGFCVGRFWVRSVKRGDVQSGRIDRNTRSQQSQRQNVHAIPLQYDDI